MRRIGGFFVRRVVVGVGVLLVIAFLWEGDEARSATAPKHFTIEERESQVSQGALIQTVGVSLPVGRLLLIRRGADLCVVRFTKFHRGHDAKPKTWFHSGYENFYAEYEWYRPELNGDFRGLDGKRGYGMLRRGAVVGLLFLNLGFPLGTDDVECGSLTPEWFYPTGVSFLVGTRYDHKLELAPTQWTELSQINLTDPKLKWYRYNESQADAFIPLKELPSLPDNGANSIEGTE